MRLTLAYSCPLNAGKRPNKAGGSWHCDQCNQSVHDISGMTADDAARFLQMRSEDESLCGEWASDADGNVLFNLGRAAAAAVAIFAAGPAMADGLDSLPETALIALFGEDGAQNVQQDLAQQADALTNDTVAPEPLIRYARGVMVLPTFQPTPTPTGSTGSNNTP